MSKKCTKEEFIAKARKIHDNKYDYSKAEYINNLTKVCIICPEHGEFWQRPANHLCGQGCPKCKGKGHNTETIIQKFREINGNKYDYSKVIFKRTDKKVCIICPIHGEFWQEPRLHLKGNGCGLCNGKNMNKDEFIRRARMIHGEEYDYSEVEYIDSHTKVCIRCPEHGEFWQQPNNHLQGNGCPICRYIKVHNKRKFTTENFIERSKNIHKNKYNYSKTEYYNIDTKVCIICPEHGEFWQTPYKHIHGQGCPKCSSSHLENEIRNLLIENDINFEQEKTFDWLKYKNNLFLDFYLPDYNIAIECQGRQHFEPVDFSGNGEKYAINEYKLLQERDNIKNKLCKEHKIKILYYSNFNKKYQYKFFKNKNTLLNKIRNVTTSSTKNKKTKQ